jgi:hypothetical protein
MMQEPGSQVKPVSWWMFQVELLPVREVWRACYSFGKDVKGLQPAHVITGSRGYFAKRGSLSESMHRINFDPRSDVIVFACRQVEHRPDKGTESISPA